MTSLMKWPPGDNTALHSQVGMANTVESRVNPLMFHELKQKFPEVPDHIVTSCLRQNNNNKQKCIVMLEKESQRYLYGGEDEVVNRMQNISVSEYRPNIHMSPSRDRSDSVSSTASGGSSHSGHGTNTPVRANISQPVIVHHGNSPGRSSPMFHQENNRLSGSPVVSHFSPADSRVTTPSPLDYRRYNSEQAHRMVHSTSSPDMHNAPNKISPPQSAPVLSNNYLPFSQGGTHYQNPAHHGYPSQRPFPNANAGYSTADTSPKNHISQCHWMSPTSRPDNFNQQYPVSHIADNSGQVTNSDRNSHAFTGQHSPYTSPRQSTAYGAPVSPRQQQAPYGTSVHPQYSQQPYNIPGQYPPLMIDVSMGGGNSANAITPSQLQQLRPTPPLTVNIQGAPHLPHNQHFNSSSGSSTPMSGAGTPTNLYPQGANYNYTYPTVPNFGGHQFGSNPLGPFPGQVAPSMVQYGDNIPPEDMEYVQALVKHQHARLDKLKQDHSPQENIAKRLRQEVESLNQELYWQQRRLPQNKIDWAGVKSLRQENSRIQMEIKKLTAEIDMFNNGHAPLGILDPQEQRNFRDDAGNLDPLALPPRQASAITPPPRPPRPRHIPTEPEEEPQWSCSACTFLNHPAVGKCEMCEMPRMTVVAR